MINSDEGPADMRGVLAILPKAHFDSAQALFKFLYDFSQFSAATAMASTNIAIVIGPNILKGMNDTGVQDTPMVLKVFISRSNFIPPSLISRSRNG